MQYPKTKRLIVSLWSLPVSGAIAIFALYLRNFVVLPGEDLLSWAQVVSSNIYLISQYMYILAYVLPFFGFWALYMILLQYHVERSAFWGLMGTLFGTALPLTTLGVFAYASPEMGRLYLAGEAHLPQVITDIALGSSLVTGTLGAFFYVGGCTLFGIAVWKSGTLAGWAGILLALHGLLISFGFSSPPAIVLSWIFLIVSGSSFIWSLSKEGPTPQQADE